MQASPSNDLGRTQAGLLRLAVKARDRKIASERLFYANGPRRKTTNLLHKAGRKMVSFNCRVRLLAGHQQIGAEASVVIRALGEPILVDMRTLLKALRQK